MYILRTARPHASAAYEAVAWIEVGQQSAYVASTKTVVAKNTVIGR